MPFFTNLERDNSSALQRKLRSAGLDSVFPGDPGYNSSAESHNPRFQFRPAAVVFPENAKEVSIAVGISTAENYNVVARSGGHSGISNSLGGQDGAVVIDLRHLDTITFDPSNIYATVGTGNRLGKIAKELNRHGRAIPHGTCPSVGIGGHSAYGGYGYTSRMWGLALDAIHSIEVVLADGTAVHASEEENSDLFWALRGAAPSFGITTSITFKTHPAPAEVTYFHYAWKGLSPDVASSIVSRWQSHFSGNSSRRPIPSHIGSDLILRAPFHNKLAMIIIGAWFAPSAGFQDFMGPFLDSVERPADTKVIVSSWIRALEEMAIDSGSHGLDDPHIRSGKLWVTSVMTPSSVDGGRLSEGAIRGLSEWLGENGKMDSLRATAWFQLCGGSSSAINSKPEDATAYANRDQTLGMNFGVMDINGSFDGEDEVGLELVKGMKDQVLMNMPKNWDYRSYMNDPDDRLPNWQHRYYGSNYHRLQRLKEKYDPEGRFSFPLGIELPGAGSNIKLKRTRD